MNTKRRRQPDDSPIAPKPAAVRVSLDEILGTVRPGHSDPERDRLWVALRAEFFRLEYGRPAPYATCRRSAWCWPQRRPPVAG